VVEAVFLLLKPPSHLPNFGFLCDMCGVFELYNEEASHSSYLQRSAPHLETKQMVKKAKIAPVAGAGGGVVSAVRRVKSMNKPPYKI
jgi:hypothetical protein